MSARCFSLTRAVSALTVTALLCGPVAATPALAASDPLPAPEVVAKAGTTKEPASRPEDRIIVKFKGAVRGNSAERGKAYGQAAKDAGVTVKELRTTASGATVVEATEQLTPEAAAEAAAVLEAQPNVEYAEVDTFMRPTNNLRIGPPDDPGISLQWSLDEQTAGMNVSGAWARSTGAGTVVAVIDTGITQHSDLNANLVPGYDFISDPNIARDGNGRDWNNTDAGDTCDGAPSSWHGTHVAGTIGAVAYNGRGVVGVAYETKIQPIRALGACGGYLSDISDALTWAVGGSVYGAPFNSNPADVVNMSLGGTASQCSTTFQTALDYAASRNATVIAAAGNENSPVSGTIPANCDKIITVGATGREGNRAGYSNYGPAVDVSAPGGDFSTGVQSGIVSTYNNGSTTPGSESYAYMQGTSMAAPHVAAVAAIMRSTARSGGIDLTPAQIEEQLKTTARPLPGTCDTGGCGAGLVDAAAAARAANPTPLKFRIWPVVGIGTVAAVGDELSVNTTATSVEPNAETFTYQWLRDGTAIPDATAPAYRVTQADSGARLSIRMIASRFDYQDLTLTTNETDPVTERPVTPAPTISGAAQVGVPLTADAGTWTPGPVTFQYQWINGTDFIDGATEATYTPGAGDLGKNLKVRVTGSGPNLAETNVVSDPTAAVLPGVLTAPEPQISGTAKVGSRLQADSGTWTEGAVLAYQWLRDGEAIFSATGSAYDLVVADLGKAISVRVTGTKDGYTSASKESARTSNVEPGTLEAPEPQITGDATVGRELTAGAGNWGEGTSLGYQWFRAGEEIPGATAAIYSVAPEDVEKTLTVRVTGTRAGYTTETRESEPTQTIASGTFELASPEVHGEARFGGRLVFIPRPNMWTPDTAISYQWYRNGQSIEAGTSAVYDLTTDDIGKTVTLRLTATRPGYLPVTSESAPTAVVQPGTLEAPAPMVTGPATVGATLTAVPGSWTSLTSLSYQWYRSGVMVLGATAPTYLLRTADLGKIMTVRVTGSKTGYTTETRDSAPTAAVASGTLSTSAPVLSGTVRVGSTLMATTMHWTSGTAYTYQWYRSGVAITGATTHLYTLGVGDLGKAMTVRVTGTKDGYSTAARDSAPTAAVAPGFLSATPVPGITGTKKVGHTLTAAPGTWTSGTTLRYQWYRSGIAIAGATGSRYTLGAADLGKGMKVSVTGSKAGYTTVSRYSGQTAAVVAGTLSGPNPWISGTLRSGYVLTANTGTWTAGTTLRYQWYRSGVAIKGATGRQYRLVTADRYDTMRVRVIGSKPGYTSLARYSGITSRIP